MKRFLDIELPKVEILIGLVFILAMLLIPYAARSDSLGFSQYDPALGGWRYYSAPNAGRKPCRFTIGTPITAPESLFGSSP